MTLRAEPTRLPEVVRLRPDVHRDGRGFFMELHHERKYLDLGFDTRFVQTNLTRSGRSTLRGLHYQLRRPQIKLVTVLSGEIFDVAVDLRRGSPSFGEWVGCRLDDRERAQLIVPAGFAHGFCVLSDRADVLYQCSDFYAPEDERALRWDDPRLKIGWPIEGPPILSARDAASPLLAEVSPDDLPRFAGTAGAPERPGGGGAPCRS